jgi:hypothetical protein
VSIEQADRKLLVLSVNLSKGDLPLRTAFPIMMTNALNWFRDSRGELREAAAAGSLAEVDLGALDSSGEAAGPLVLRAPDGTATMLPGEADKVTVGPLDQCGVWTVQREPADEGASSNGADRAQLQLACNLASSAESDLRCPLDRPEMSQAALAGLGARPIWFYLIAAAVALIVTEWFLYQRRWIS